MRRRTRLCAGHRDNHKYRGIKNSKDQKGQCLADAGIRWILRMSARRGFLLKWQAVVDREALKSRIHRIPVANPSALKMESMEVR